MKSIYSKGFIYEGVDDSVAENQKNNNPSYSSKAAQEYLASLLHFPYLGDNLKEGEDVTGKYVKGWQIYKFHDEWVDTDEYTYHLEVPEFRRIVCKPLPVQGSDNDLLTRQFPGKDGSQITNDTTDEELEFFMNRPKKEIVLENKDVWEWVAIFYGSLINLVNLKSHKDTIGKDADYLEQQPKVWYAAKQAVELWKQSDYGAKPVSLPVHTEVHVEVKELTDKDRIWALEQIVAIKEKERQEWADMCIRKQARIEYLEEQLRLANL